MLDGMMRLETAVMPKIESLQAKLT